MPAGAGPDLMTVPDNCDVFVSFVVVMLLGISMLFAGRFRPAGVGLLTGTVATFGALLLLGAMFSGVD